jgi:hypothetical protein
VAQLGKFKKAAPYSADGINTKRYKEGDVLWFPDNIAMGLAEGEDDATIEIISDAKPGEGEAENALNTYEAATSRDAPLDEYDRRLMVASDAELKAIIARGGTAVSGNLVHALLVSAAKRQLLAEERGKEPILGVDPNSGVTEQPLAAPGAPTPPSAPVAIENAKIAAEATEAAREGAPAKRGRRSSTDTSTGE